MQEDKVYEQVTQLMTDGAIVLDVLSKEETDTFRKQIIEEVMTAPEVVPGVAKTPGDLVAGGFGALGTPTSFHGGAVRACRTKVAEKINFFLRILATRTQLPNSEIVYDRFRYENKGTSATGEKFHRDECNSQQVLPSDLIFGGWVNLSDNGAEQKFLYLPGTQLSTNNGGGGLATAKPTLAQQKMLRKAVAKPGQLVLFYQNIMHKVAGGKIPSDLCRLHFGVRLTTSDKPLFDLTEVFDQKKIPKIPSGQDARMWPKLWWTNWRGKFGDFVARFHPSLRIQRALKSGSERTFIIVPEVMDPPENMRAHLPDYDEEERALYKPTPLEPVEIPQSPPSQGAIFMDLSSDDDEDDEDAIVLSMKRSKSADYSERPAKRACQ